MTQENSWLNDCKHINCPIYKSMYDDILIEKKSPIKRSIQLFCRKANYKQKTEKFVVNEILEKQIDEILKSQNMGIQYRDIPDIDKSYAEIIEEKCFCQEATMMEKYALNKYYFKKSFTDTADESTLRDIWDEKYIFFFKRLSQLLLNENNLFYKISELNNYKHLFPVEIKKIKLNDDIKENIFNEFSFKYVSKNSSNIKIAKEIYNTYFSSHIVNQKTDDNKNVFYTIDENVYDYFEFAKEYLILNNESYLTYNKIFEIQSVSGDCIEI